MSMWLHSLGWAGGLMPKLAEGSRIVDVASPGGMGPGEEGGLGEGGGEGAGEGAELGVGGGGGGAEGWVGRGGRGGAGAGGGRGRGWRGGLGGWGGMKRGGWSHVLMDGENHVTKGKRRATSGISLSLDSEWLTPDFGKRGFDRLSVQINLCLKTPKKGNPKTPF